MTRAKKERRTMLCEEGIACAGNQREENVAHGKTESISA